MVRRVAPVWYLHDDDEYLPSSTEWYLDRATLVSKDGQRTVLKGGGSAPEDKLPLCSTWPFAGDSADYWLEVPESDWTGDIASARAYVSIRRVNPGFLDVSFWFWYPGNGCGTARLRTLVFDSTVMTEERIPLTTLGFHVSDWEKITVRVTDDAENRIDSVYFAQHSGGHWLKPEQLEREPSGQFAVYASRHGHASYPTAGPNYTAHVKTAKSGIWAKLTPSALEFWLRNDTMKGPKVDCAVHHEIVHIHEGPDGIALTADGDAAAAPAFAGRIETAGGAVRLREPKWLNFPYRWGPETEQKITHETMFAALKAAAAPLIIYGAMTLGAILPILGVIAGLLVPVLVKQGNECGKPGPKVKFISNGVVDEESEPEPDNLFEDAVDDKLAGMIAWVETAGKDVADWAEARGKEAAALGEGAGGATAEWATDIGEGTASWATGVGTDTANWFKEGGGDAVDWAKNAGSKAADWVTGVASDADDVLNRLKI